MVRSWCQLIGLVYLLVAAVAIIGTGFKTATGDGAEALFALVEHPIMGLVVGLLATSLVQSSSTVTSVIVGLVAGGLPVNLAIPMVMGANIGTSITNTIVSLAHLRVAGEFQKAFAAATVLDMFNLMAVALFLPLELLFHPLESMSLWLAQSLTGGSGVDPGQFNLVHWLTYPVQAFFQWPQRILPPFWVGLWQIVGGIGLIVMSIVLLGKLLKQLMVDRARELLKSAMGRGPLSGILSGTIATVLFQSSSTTTSLMVPLAGHGILSLKEIYPFTLGANIGTCITALIAATAIDGPLAVAALEIALVHFLFNFLGVLVIYGMPLWRNLPVWAAEWLAAAAGRHRGFALAYVLGVFFALPGFLLLVPFLWSPR
jgi:sodium-dependent phosphate cotransporter